jgi:TolB-like protein/tetratricopeptide (TPR) repeat protein
LAKAFEVQPGLNEDRADAPTLDVDAVGRTSEGQILGTPAYMSPEQARGQKVDKRTDVWAFGCCLYEALTGRRPFRGKTSSDLIAEILKADPDWSQVPNETPSHIVLLLRRSLEKDARRRLGSMRDLAITFEETTSELRQSRSDVQAPVAARGAGPDRSRRGRFIGGLAAGLVVATIALGWFFFSNRSDEDTGREAPAETKIERIAVLPFLDNSGDKDQDWFVDGMTVALITELARIDALTVISRTSAMQYRNSDRPIREIALQLRADALVEGSVTRVGDDVRITASLIDGPTEKMLWSDQYDGTLDDVLNLQSKIAAAVAGEINIVLTPEEKAELERDQNVNPRALDAYLRGVYELNVYSGHGRGRAISYFEEALRIEPDYALAYAQLSAALVRQFVWGFATRADVSEKARAADEAALELEPDLSLAWTARARRTESLEWDWTEAQTYHARAIEADPEDANTIYAYAFGLAMYGDHPEEAIKFGQRAIELDPSVLVYQVDLAEIFICAGRFDEAAEHLDRVFNTDPDFVPLIVVRGYLGILTGQYEEAARDAQRVLDLSGDRRHLEYLGTALAFSGRTEEARAALDEFEDLSKREFIQKAELGMVHLALGNHDEAYELFQQSLQAREFKLIWLKATGFFDAVEVDARLRELLDQVRGH